MKVTDKTQKSDPNPVCHVYGIIVQEVRAWTSWPRKQLIAFWEPGLIGRKPTVGISLTTALLVYSLAGVMPAQAAQLNSFNGSIGGEVKNITGVAQMGAAVILYNRYDRAIRQVLTDAKGNFAFDALSPDLYSIRVSHDSLFPVSTEHFGAAGFAEPADDQPGRDAELSGACLIRPIHGIVDDTGLEVGAALGSIHAAGAAVPGFERV